ncbi:MAG: MarR family winged helix-turn-helix transcriptional regulator [Flavobacteriaceae bacterium]
MKKQTFDSALRSTWQSVSKMYNKEAAKFESTMATGFALLSIDPEGTPATALGPKMGMEGTSLSRLLKGMESRRLIERHPNPEDGRGVLIHLTAFGKEKRNYSREVVLAFNEQVTEQLDSTKIEHFYEVINCIRELSADFELNLATTTSEKKLS